jgi:uncharacterized repeat protein (TIGR04138 family)
MQPAQFEHAIEKIVERDSRFDPHAYLFLKEALDFTLKRAAAGNGGRARHVAGRELLEGFRDLALQEFGPMALTLLHEWGVTRTRDVGEMVFALIDEQMFGKQESDTLEDFDDLYDFEEAFRTPFLPKTVLAAERSA